jgi:hypothetical protein
MSYRTLVLIPFIMVAGLLAGAYVTSSGGQLSQAFLRTEISIVKALAVAGSLVAALSYRRGEYLRRAWLLNGSCMSILLLRDVTLAFPRTDTIQWIQAAIMVVANSCWAAGIFMLGRAWRVAGVELGHSRAARNSVVAAAWIIAGAASGPGIYDALRHLGDTPAHSVMELAIGLADMVSFGFIAPVLLTAVALRGGLLGWPWGLLTSGLVGWLAYDATAYLREAVLHVDPNASRLVVESFRSLACTFTFAAGIAQHLVQLRAKAGDPAPNPARVASG